MVRESADCPITLREQAAHLKLMNLVGYCTYVLQDEVRDSLREGGCERGGKGEGGER